MNNETFEIFNNGNLVIPKKNINFNQLAWNKHPTFEGVELKHIITGKETNGQFSYHIVKIAPGKSIGNHIHEKQIETHEVIFGKGKCINNGFEIEYKPGTISIIPAKIPHKVTADENGLYIFAKFIPALC